MRQPSDLTQDAFERLLARAVQIDDAGHERIDLDRARAIALEVGVSAGAWEAALREMHPPIPTRSATPTPVAHASASASRSWNGPLSIALVGGVLGAVAGFAAPRLGDAVIAAGVFAIAAGVALAVKESYQQRVRARSYALAAWWLAVPAGIMIGMREPHIDPIVFGAVSWAWCELVGAALRWRTRSARENSASVTPDTTPIPR